MNKKNGFTLIELLVVIAIIGLISSIVFASLEKSRDKAKDSAIKSEMVNLRSAAELFFSKNQSYGTALSSCDPNPQPNSVWNDQDIKNLIASLKKKASVLSCTNSATAWEVNAQLATDPSKYFCVDSNSRAVETAGTPVLTDVSCGASLPGGGSSYSVNLASGQATLSFAPPGPSFSAGTDVLVTIVADTGYLINGAGDNGVGISHCPTGGSGVPSCSFTISNISGNHTINVSTIPIPPEAPEA